MSILHKPQYMVPVKGIIGNPVKIRYGPAAVIGDERRIKK